MTDLCLQPTTFFVKEEPANKRQEAEFIPGKLLTRYTSSIDQVRGDLKLDEDGSLTFVEKEGLRLSSDHSTVAWRRTSTFPVHD
jgi:photosystem II oxygen-evolving enhancer protein 1